MAKKTSRRNFTKPSGYFERHAKAFGRKPGEDPNEILKRGLRVAEHSPGRLMVTNKEREKPTPIPESDI